MNIEIASQEVASLIEALYDGVLRRIAWSTNDPPLGWRHSLDIKTAQTVINSMMSAYVNVMMAWRDDDTFGKDPRFDDEFTLNDAAMDAIAVITLAEKWDDIPVHLRHTTKGDCELCDEVYRIRE